MPESIHIAEILEADYPRFRGKDPTLPATYGEWRASHLERIRGMQRNRQIPISRPIAFDDFAQRNGILHNVSFDQLNRDDYADEQAKAEAVASRL